MPWRKYHGKDGTHVSHLLLALGVPFALFCLFLSLYAPSHGIILQTIGVSVIAVTLFLGFRHSGISVETSPHGIFFTYLSKQAYIPWVAYKKIMLVKIHTSCGLSDVTELTEEEYEGTLDLSRTHAGLVILRNGTRYEIPVLDQEALALIEQGYEAYLNLSKASPS